MKPVIVVFKDKNLCCEAKTLSVSFFRSAKIFILSELSDLSVSLNFHTLPSSRIFGLFIAKNPNRAACVCLLLGLIH
jgi:hypothetical protein